MLPEETCTRPFWPRHPRACWCCGEELEARRGEEVLHVVPLWPLCSDQLFVLQTTDLSVVFRESSATTPLVFVLSPGTDPAADLYKFAEEMKFSEKLSAISLGQGQVSCRC